MAIEAVNGDGSIATTVTLTVTPAAGETWALTNVGVTGSLDKIAKISISTGGSDPDSTDGPGMSLAHTEQAAWMTVENNPTGPLIITDSSPLKIKNGGTSTQGYNYSGVKL